MTNRYPTVLVTGAAGLIGSAVVRRLRARGSRVVACDDFSIGTWRHEEDGIQWDSFDVGDASWPDRLASYAVHAVIHCAAHPGGRSLQEPSENVRVNTLGSMRLFEGCARAHVPVVYLSSSAVYGEQPAVPIPEAATLRPATVYAACKVACEHFLRILAAGYGLQWTALRLFATYGAGHRPSKHQGIVNVMLTQLLEGNQVVVRGSLDRVRDIVYVEDTARAIVECLVNNATRGQALNVGTGVELTIRRLIEMLCRLLGRSMDDITITEQAPTVGDPQYNVADVTQLTTLTGFTPEYAVEQGLEHLVQARMRVAGAGAV